MDRVMDWLARAEDWLDGWGKPGWIAAMVVAFVLAWPIGLALLGYMIWSGRMGCSTWRRRAATRPTGNSAFDEYREETLRRLDEEQEAFTGFLEKLRRAKDRAEFDRFMDERRRAGESPDGEPA